MHSQKQELDLSRLRRQLEELLAMVKADHDGATFDRRPETALTESDTCISGNHSEPVTANESCEVAYQELADPDERDVLYDDALVVVTEFGQASPAILQMWLSIDYGRASTIISRFQADGLISAKGRIRHKAFELRRAPEQKT